MGEFIQNNTVWLVPCASIILTIIIQTASKPESFSIIFIDFLDFGFDLSIAAMILMLAGIKDNLGTWLVFAFFALIIITSTIVTRFGWDKEKLKKNLIGILVPDACGILILIMATLYVGGILR